MHSPPWQERTSQQHTTQAPHYQSRKQHRVGRRRQWRDKWSWPVCGSKIRHRRRTQAHKDPKERTAQPLRRSARRRKACIETHRSSPWSVRKYRRDRTGPASRCPADNTGRRGKGPPRCGVCTGTRLGKRDRPRLAFGSCMCLRGKAREPLHLRGSTARRCTRRHACQLKQGHVSNYQAHKSIRRSSCRPAQSGPVCRRTCLRCIKCSLPQKRDQKKMRTSQAGREWAPRYQPSRSRPASRCYRPRRRLGC
jgi:hypothetical protein